MPQHHNTAAIRMPLERFCYLPYVAFLRMLHSAGLRRHNALAHKGCYFTFRAVLRCHWFCFSYTISTVILWWTL
jgi:hypothetical protein